ncbi:MAG: anti-anti-sigma regulatory factor [Glaciecola sp.]|uniref:STAS domain-containing protein n=1 Tax=Congregibacter sp. TaxID=2744308 RepID=UPI0039E2F680
MSEGQVLAAQESGAYVLMFVGDVRLTLCASIEEYVENMLNDPQFSSVWVDLCGAQGIDSTTLGQLAKLAISVHKRFDFRPAIYCCDAGINRLLGSMGLDRLFEMHEKTCCATGSGQSIPMIPGSEDDVREKVLEAHRALMDVSPENRTRFSELVATLERR